MNVNILDIYCVLLTKFIGVKQAAYTRWERYEEDEDWNEFVGACVMVNKIAQLRKNYINLYKG